MFYVYVLKLVDKIYIGITSNIDGTLDQLFFNEKYAWTLKYLPLKIIEIAEIYSLCEEDEYVVEYIEKYGADNVVGGSFSQSDTIQELEKQIQQMDKTFCRNCYLEKYGQIACHRCEKTGYTMSECTYVTIDDKSVPYKRTRRKKRAGKKNLDSPKT